MMRRFGQASKAWCLGTNTEKTVFQDFMFTLNIRTNIMHYKNKQLAGECMVIMDYK